MRRDDEPRQLQTKYLDTIVKYRMPQAISRYKDLVDGIDAFHELPRRDLHEHFSNDARHGTKKRNGLRGPRAPSDKQMQIAQSHLPYNHVPPALSLVGDVPQSVP